MRSETDGLVFDGFPGFALPHVRDRVRAASPRAKFVVMLREPVRPEAGRPLGLAGKFRRWRACCRTGA